MVSRPPPGKGPEGAMAKGLGGKGGRELVDYQLHRRNLKICMYFFLLAGGGRGEGKAIINFILFLLTKLY